MNIDKKALKSIVDEIEASRLRQKAETEHQREVMKRAKAHQLDAKAVRIVLQRRAMGDSKRDEQDYYVHAYELALGGKKLAAEALEAGATIREAAAAGGVSTGAAGNLAKSVQKPSFVDELHKEARPVATHTEHPSAPSPIAGHRGGAPLQEQKGAGDDAVEAGSGIDGGDAGEARRPAEGRRGEDAGPLAEAARNVGVAGPEVPEGVRLQNLPADRGIAPVRSSPLGPVLSNAPPDDAEISPTPEQDAEGKGPPEAKPSTTESDGLEIPEFLRAAKTRGGPLQTHK